MTIEEAIAHAREVAKIHRNNDKLNKTLGKSSPYYNTDCIKCAEEHEQLAEWLKELKFLRQWKYDIINKFCEYDCNSLDELVQKIYSKAVDDFVNACKEDILCQTFGLHQNRIEQIAEQLKAGETK